MVRWSPEAVPGVRRACTNASSGAGRGGHPRVCAYPRPPALKPVPVANQPTAQPDECDEQSEQEGQEHTRADQDGVCIYREKSVWYHHVRHRRDSGDASLSART